MSASASAADRPGVRRRKGGFRRALANASGTTRGRIGIALAVIVNLVAFGGPFIPGQDPLAFVAAPFAPPGGSAGPLGADVLGRSVLARTLDGGWQLLLMAAAATALAVGVGAVLGVLAAYKEGWTDLLLMRGADVVLVIPQLILALLLVSISGSSTALVVFAVAVSQAPQVARVIHGSAQNICEQDFVKAVALWGVPARQVIRRHVLPNLTTPLSVEAGLRLGFSIILISGLNFLGFGVDPPAPSWGVMINENRVGMELSPLPVLVPALLLGMLAVGTNLFADALARANLNAGEFEALELASLPKET